MLGSSARLLRLLSLLQSRPTWAGPDLTSRLEVTDRTLRRDVDRLRSLGYPVDSTSGPAGGYMLGAGASLPPLMLDNDEGLAVAIALHGASSDVRGVAEAGQRALAKIDKVLPSRLRKRLDALRTSIVRVPDSGPKVELGIVDTLAAACAEHRVVRLQYRDQAGQASRVEAQWRKENNSQHREPDDGEQPANGLDSGGKWLQTGGRRLMHRRACLL